MLAGSSSASLKGKFRNSDALEAVYSMQALATHGTRFGRKLVDNVDVLVSMQAATSFSSPSRTENS